MKNIYRIIVGHVAPKDWSIATVCFLVAENDEQVFNWLASEPTVNDKKIYNSWLEDREDDEWDDEDGKYLNFKSKLIDIKGEINDDDYDFTDSHYGITLYGWELMKEDFYYDANYNELFELGVLIMVK